jgi:hypothetical protein
MPFSRFSRQFNKKLEKHSLQVKKPGNREKVSLCTCVQGSLTVESAFAIPFFFLAMVMLICFIDVLRIQTIITTTLCESAKELGMYAYVSEQDEGQSPIGNCSTAVCIAYGSKQVSDRLKGESLPGIVGGSKGVSLLLSKYENQTVDLYAVYQYRPPISLIPLSGIKLEARGRVKAWTGYNGEGNSEQENEQELVYVTPNESVYHETNECTYLELSVSLVSGKSLESLRNQYGEKYHSCEKCGDQKTGSSSSYYITDKGNKYHSNKTCSGLKRTVIAIKKSSADHLRVCSRCK